MPWYSGRRIYLSTLRQILQIQLARLYQFLLVQKFSEMTVDLLLNADSESSSGWSLDFILVLDDFQIGSNRFLKKITGFHELLKATWDTTLLSIAHGVYESFSNPLTPSLPKKVAHPTTLAPTSLILFTASRLVTPPTPMILIVRIASSA